MDLGAAFEAHLGKPVYVALGLTIPLSILRFRPIRGDCMSVLGIAREIGAALNVPVRLPEIKTQETEDLAGRHVSIEVQEQQLCPRYSARVMTDIVRAILRAGCSAVCWRQACGRFQYCGYYQLCNAGNGAAAACV